MGSFVFFILYPIFHSWSHKFRLYMSPSKRFAFVELGQTGALCTTASWLIALPCKQNDLYEATERSVEHKHLKLSPYMLEGDGSARNLHKRYSVHEINTQMLSLEEPSCSCEDAIVLPSPSLRQPFWRQRRVSAPWRASGAGGCELASEPEPDGRDVAWRADWRRRDVAV